MPNVLPRGNSRASARAMGVKKMVLHGCLPLLAFFCLGWADTWEEIRSAAETVYAVQADFVQEKHLPILAKPLVSQGRFYFYAPRSLRWEYHAPVRSILIMHQGRVTRFVADDAEWRRERGPGLEAMQMVLQEIALWLSGRFDENPSFHARLESDRRIVLTPRQAAHGEFVHSITLRLGTQPGTLESVVIHESETAFTRLTFAHTRLNPALDDALFREAP